MFLVNKPSDESVRQFLETQKSKSLSYSEVGASRDGVAPPGYNVDHNRVRLGHGREIFERAVAAVRHCKMFDFKWVKLYRNDAPIETGETIAIRVNHFGFWSLNATRTVYVFEEATDAIEKYGFAYGTLAEHAERGEERFSVEYHKTDDAVWYDLFAFSKPNGFLTRLGYPFSRRLQRRFAIEMKAAMTRAVQNDVASNQSK